MASWRAGWVVVATAVLASCAVVSKDKFMQYVDADQDGWPVVPATADDKGPVDCDDDDPDIYPGAPDVRGDKCDADCGEEPDADGDDWPDDADCGPYDPTVYPWSAAERAGDGKDSDCDGSDGKRTDPRPDVAYDTSYPPDGQKAFDPAVACGHPSVPKAQ